MIRVKICCISSIEEAKIAVEMGASALGLVSEMPSGPGVIDEASIGDIAAGIPPAVSRFLLTSMNSAVEIKAQQSRCGVDTLQLVDAISESELEILRSELPGVHLVKVIHVEGPHSVDEAIAFDTLADAILLDSGNTSSEVKELGGTGRTHDWSLSRKIVKECSAPVFLAGGLNPKNVGEVIAQVQPFVVNHPPANAQAAPSPAPNPPFAPKIC